MKHPHTGSEDGKLARLAERSSWIIFEASSSPLLRASREKITICTNRVTITKKTLFGFEEFPMPIENVTSARVYMHLLSASLTIETFGVPKPDPITKMKVNDARLARRYILALVECKKSNIDLSHLSLPELRSELKKIGMVRYTTGEKNYHNI